MQRFIRLIRKLWRPAVAVPGLAALLVIDRDTTRPASDLDILISAAEIRERVAQMGREIDAELRRRRAYLPDFRLERLVHVPGGLVPGHPAPGSY